MSSQQMSSQEAPPPGPAEIARLRARVAELEAEQAWTRKQHKLWLDERRAMIVELRKLRAADKWRDRFTKAEKMQA